MKQRLLATLACLILCQLGWAQKRVILDTDPSSDPDDVGCMAMLHTLATRGECEILAVVNSIDHHQAPLSISAINAFYGRGAIPVGDYRGYETSKDAPEELYTHMIAKEYERPLRHAGDAIDSVELYRQILATASDKSISIIVIGTMHNLYALLRSDACQYSPLSGRELVRQKVQQVVTMGGNFIEGKGLDRTNWGGSEELCGYTSWSCLNAERNEMCRYVIEHCPAPFVASGWEVGCGDYHNAKQGNVMTGQGLKSLPDRHIARKSYEYHFAKRGGGDRISRHSNDQCALHFAIRGEGDNYQAFLNGNITLSDQGVCEWSAAPNGIQGYIQKKRDPKAIAREIESLMLGQGSGDSSIPLKQHHVASQLGTGPSKPGPITHRFVDGQGLRLTWAAATHSDPADWVVGYRVYRNGQPVGTVFGTQFIDAPNDRPSNDDRPGQRLKYRVIAISASGVESPAVERHVQVVAN